MKLTEGYIAFILAVSVIAGCFGVYSFVQLYFKIKMKEGVVVEMQKQNDIFEVTEVEEAEMPTFIKDGSLLSVFTADSGKLIEMHPGTTQVKSVLSANFARIVFEGISISEIRDARWWGDLKNVRYALKENGKWQNP